MTRGQLLAMALGRLLAAGYPAKDMQVVGPNPLRADWSMDPFTLTEKDGYFYGRGTSDIKDMAAIFTTTLIRLKRGGFRPDRDIPALASRGRSAARR
jgi:hypothetical protein